MKYLGFLASILLGKLEQAFTFVADCEYEGPALDGCWGFADIPMEVSRVCVSFFNRMPWMILLDNQQWVEENFAACDFNHKRRTDRMKVVAQNMLARPDGSLPMQNNDWSDLKAAYRLFDRPEVTFAAVASPHWQQTRNTKPGRYLLISDTTDINLYSHKATKGLGMLGDGKGRGIQLHNCLMYDSGQRQIVGQAGAITFYRKPAPKKEKRMQRLNRRRESSLWGELVDQVGEAPEGSQWIHVFDRGGDNFEAICHIKQSGNDWVIRAAKESRKVIDRDGQKCVLKEAAEKATLLGSYDLNLRSRPGVAARTAKIHVSSTTVKFPRPSQFSRWVRESGIHELSINVVIVQEVDPPTGVKVIRWVLLTSLQAATFEQAWQVIEDYENRWLVEEYHKVTKTGCSIEKHALQTAERTEALMGLISVLATRLLQLKLIGRNQPEASAATHIPPHWLRCMQAARPKLRGRTLSVYEFFRELAKMGGFIGRKSDGEPGWLTIWRGYQKLTLLLDGMRLAEQTKSKSCG